MRNSKTLLCTLLILTLALSGCGAKQASTNSAAGTDAAALLTEVKTTQFFTAEALPDDDVKSILSAGVNAPSAMNTQPWHFTAITDGELTQKLKDAMSSMKPPAFKKGKAPDAPPAENQGENADGAAEAPSDAPEKPEGIPERPEGKHERPEGMPERPEGKHERPEGMPERPEGKHERPEGAPDAQGGAPIVTTSADGNADFSKAPNKAGIGDAPLTIVISCERNAELSAGLAVQNMAAEAQLLGYGTKILTSPTMALNGENADELRKLLNIPDGQRVAAVLLVGKAATGEENPDATSSATTRNDFDDVVTIIK